MALGGLLIWAFVLTMSLFAARWKRTSCNEVAASRVIVWGGVIFPLTVLVALLAYALWLMPSLRPFAGGEKSRIRIEVIGHQFWWQVIYHTPARAPVFSANEVRLPVGERVEFELKSADMIHSFWIPALGGKMDLIPGRTNRLSLLATKAGTYRGQCAEFCGVSHALMAFPVITTSAGEFNAWLDDNTRPSADLAINSPGKLLFDREGCAKCHRVSGTSAQGDGGPDLSRIGSRLSIGAGLLDNDVDTLARFILNPSAVKPGAQMPRYPHLSPQEAGQIAAWLKALR